MKNRSFNPPLIVAVAILLLTTTSFLANALDESEVSGKFMGTVPVPEKLAIDDVRDTIAMTVAGRGWQVLVKEEDHVIGYIEHRRREVTLTLIFDENKISLYSDGRLVNTMSEKVRKDPARGWVENIKKDLDKALSVAAAGK